MIPAPWRYHGPPLDTLTPDEVLATCQWALSVLESNAATIHAKASGADAMRILLETTDAKTRSLGHAWPILRKAVDPTLGRCHVCLELYTGADDGRCEPCRAHAWTSHREYLDWKQAWTQTHRHTHQDA